MPRRGGAITICLTIPPLTEWQARVTRAWLGPVAASWWVHHFGPKQLERHAYPGQPSTPTRPPVRPCTCHYWAARSNHTHVETLNHTLIPMYDLPAVSWFHIDPLCPHHGDINALTQANPPLGRRITIPRAMIEGDIPGSLYTQITNDRLDGR